LFFTFSVSIFWFHPSNIPSSQSFHLAFIISGEPTAPRRVQSIPKDVIRSRGGGYGQRAEFAVWTPLVFCGGGVKESCSLVETDRRRLISSLFSLQSSTHHCFTFFLRSLIYLLETRALLTQQL